MIASIRRRRVFAELRHRGQRVKHGAVRLTFVDLTDADRLDITGRAGQSLGSTPQVAYALGRRFGTAVERNRARRRLRDAFTLTWTHHQQTVDPASQLCGAFLLSGHRGLLTIPFDRLVADLSSCLTKLVASPSRRSDPRR